MPNSFAQVPNFPEDAAFDGIAMANRKRLPIAAVFDVDPEAVT